MKNIAILFCLLAIITFKSSQPDIKEYVEFNNDGPDTKVLPPILISKQKLNIKLQEPDLTIFKRQQQSFPNVTQEQFIKLNFSQYVTDDSTYADIVSFVLTHTKFYSRFPYSLYPEGKWDVTANGKRFNICYKTQDDFVRDLVRYLKSHNRDKEIIDLVADIH